MTDVQTALDPQQENRRLRAAAETMRSRQRLALGGVAAGAMVIGARHQFAQVIPAPVGLAVLAGGIAIPLLAAIPFLRSSCPKCRQRYHSLASVFRHPDNPADCKSCGFNINKHIPRYS
ncbi:hypothetical protein [Lysobacter niastensis]|uniref:Zinc ribbon domain-containing protein n=1 Tax=Lysobacter niastensis TaxID=380629 RepID=A0ABS0B873_9GAMM|nr:hypothetical protein [Lysobacter niastensis]MBF6025224.1 hypothetical protein [Lysobacter niastensis]